jgi:hypothetical protein
MEDKLIEIIKRLQKDNPAILEGLDKLSAEGIRADKIKLYEILVKTNEQFKYDEVDKVLKHHENSRLDINWNKGEYIYRIVISRRKREPEKPKKERQVKPSGENQPVTETKDSAA